MNQREVRRKIIMSRRTGPRPKEGGDNCMTDKEAQILTEVQKDPEKRLNDQELNLLVDLKHEGMQCDKIIKKILEEREKNKE